MSQDNNPQGKRVAILIAISEYANAALSLPCGKKDGSLIRVLTNGLDRFDEILDLSALKESSMLKDRLASFVQSQKGTRIDEVFFYYSGHGDFSADNFLFLLPDFDEKKKSQTSLKNTELDELLARSPRS